MILLKTEEMREMDRLTIESGVPELLLMETAGRGVAEIARDVLRKNELEDPHITVVCGKGNNGGDGFVAARFLDMWGFEVEIIFLGAVKELSGVNKTNCEFCKLREINVIEYKDTNISKLNKKLGDTDFIIDAMLGTGLQGDVRNKYADIIDLINDTINPRVLAVDIPSGLDGDTGEVHGRAIFADYTATMAFSKLGLVLYPAPQYTGEVYIIDLGIPGSVINQVNFNHYLLEEQDARSLLPLRDMEGHKGTFGKVGVIGGSKGMTGAPFLTGKSALKTGSGLVKLIVPGEVESIIESNIPELITKGLSSEDGHFGLESYNQLFELIDKFDILAVGPGLGQNNIIEKIVIDLIKNTKIPMVLDADGINSVKDPAIFKKRSDPIILTPHPGEMARLIDEDISFVQKNRVELSRKFALEFGVYLILKGAATVVAHPNGNIFINPTGNDGMATAGSGDVLTGITASLVGQGLDCDSASILAPYIHGLSGDFACDELGAYSLTASDLINNISDAIQQIQ